VTRPSRRMPPADGHYCDRCRRFARSSTGIGKGDTKAIRRAPSARTAKPIALADVTAGTPVSVHQRALSHRAILSAGQ